MQPLPWVTWQGHWPCPGQERGEAAHMRNRRCARVKGGVWGRVGVAQISLKAWMDHFFKCFTCSVPPIWPESVLPPKLSDHQSRSASEAWRKDVQEMKGCGGGGWHCRHTPPFFSPLPHFAWLSLLSVKSCLGAFSLTTKGREKKNEWGTFILQSSPSIHRLNPRSCWDRARVCWEQDEQSDSRGGRFVSTLPLITLNILKSSIFHEGLFAGSGVCAAFPILFSLPIPLYTFQDVSVRDSIRKSWGSNREFGPKYLESWQGTVVVTVLHMNKLNKVWFWDKLKKNKFCIIYLSKLKKMHVF